jgi:hypothetical protein
MPELSRFFGIIITMYWRDHNPPHFHASYGSDEALITMDGEVYSGSLPRRALSLVREWLAMHRQELLHLRDCELEAHYKRVKAVDLLHWRFNTMIPIR